MTGGRLTNLRKSAGLTQTELSQKMAEQGIRISSSLIKYLETGDRALTKENLRNYAAFFGVNEKYITGEAKYRDRAEEVAEKMAEGVKESPEEERVRMEGRTAVWKAAERWIRASFPDESLEELEAQGRINLFEIFCSVTEPVQEAIWKAKI